MFVVKLKKDWSIIKPKVLICANSYPPQVGGLATYSKQLSKNLAKFKFDVTVLAPTSPTYKSYDKKISYNILRGIFYLAIQ